jgi:WD40 repeat protein
VLLFAVGALLPGGFMIGIELSQAIQVPVILQRRQSVQTRYKLLGSVKRYVESRLDQSLHNAVSLHRHTSQEPHPPRLWDVEVKIGTQPSARLLPEKDIIEVFDLPSIGGKLLILGASGSGKTTTLLELARKLVARAFTDPRSPVPVLFNLCSWDSRLPLADWLVSQLKSNCGIAPDTAKKWLESGELVPLLDGLDELRSEWQKPCVLAINQFIQQVQPKHLVVCTGMSEYASAKTLMQLPAAIYLLPLTEPQIQDYLSRSGLQYLWPSLQQDPNLLNWAKTPLFLNILTLAAEEISLPEWQQRHSPESRQRYLLDAFIQKQLKQLRAQQSRRWLSWLAKRLKRDSADEFLIENMQPVWLSNPTQRWLYRLGVGLILGLTGGLSCGLSFGLNFGLIGGFILALFGGLNFQIVPVKPLNLSPQKAVSGAIVGLSLGLLAGLFGSVFLAIAGQLVGGLFGLLRACLGGLIGGLIFAIFQAVSDSEIEPKTAPNQGMWQSAGTAGIFTLTGGLIFGLIGWLISGRPGLSGTSLGLLAGLGMGGIPCLQHLTLRLILWRDGDLPWNFAGFLNSAAQQLLLQKIGGRYQFYHELLRDHFAAPPLGEMVLRKSSQLAGTIAGHSESVQAVAVTPQGNLAVTGSDDKTVKIWQVVTNLDGKRGLQPARTLSGHSGCVRTLAVSPDGQLVASGSNDKTVKIWYLGAGKSELPQGTLLHTLASHSNWVRAVAFSPDGQFLASCGDDTAINIWYVRTGQLLDSFSAHRDYVRCLAFSPDGTILATGSDDKTIKIWHLSSDGRVHREPALTLEGHSGYVRTLAISANGQVIVSGSDDQTITVWQLGAGDPRRPAGSSVRILGGHSSSVHSVAVSPDGQILASCSRDKTIKIWRLSTGELLKTFSERAYAFSVAFTPDGQMLAAGSQDRTVKLLPVSA